MAAIFSFRCPHCDRIHEGSPSFGFRAPDPYLEQVEEVQEAGHLSSDLCRYRDSEGEHYFIRVCLEVPIRGISEPFLWGVWVSLSVKNFQRYLETYDEPDPEDCYFGWLCNALPCYERSTYAMKTQVHPRPGNTRPFILLEQTDHPLSVDFHEGISIQRAQALAAAMLHG